MSRSRKPPKGKVLLARVRRARVRGLSGYRLRILHERDAAKWRDYRAAYQQMVALCLDHWSSIPEWP